MGEDLSASDEREDFQIRAFLLGTLQFEQSEAITHRLAEDAEFRETVEAVEEELFDDFARGRLSSADKKRFSSRYLTTPEGRARAEFARAFAGNSVVPRWPLRATALAASIVLLCAVSFQIGRQSRNPVVTIDLRPGFVRGTPSPSSLDLPRWAALIDFRLYPDKPDGDRATILDLGEKQIATAQTSALPDGGRRFRVPTELLSSGVYIIQLHQGLETSATFVVRIEKK